MLSPHILALAFVVAPSLVSAAIFPSDSLVKMIDSKGFKKAMKLNVHGPIHHLRIHDANYVFRKQVWWLSLHLGVVYVLNCFQHFTFRLT